MSAAESKSILPEPPAELKQLSEQLSARIRERILADGPIPFSTFMEMALYEPGLGYYSAGLRKFGEGGDFVTAPELGSIFATCLARQTDEVAAQLGNYSIMEIGAGNGSMAADMLKALAHRPPAHYWILERSAHLRQVQHETLQQRAPEWLDRVSWLDTPPESPWQGVIVANEVLDALPVERFRISAKSVQQVKVDVREEGFGWSAQVAPPEFEAAVRTVTGNLPEELPDGYNSEINPLMAAWLRSVTETLQRGCALFIDYGYPRREYYRAERSSGTVVCHYRHRASTDPFRWPGLQDITAFVDFTALAEAGQAAGLECAGYTSQAMFLIACGLEESMADAVDLPEADQIKLASEVRQLTLPGIMGEKFQVMALTRGIEEPLRGFQMMDLGYRL